MSLSVELPRLRAAAAGGVCAVTAVGAHAQGHGQLPDTPALLAVTATAALLGLLAGRPRRADGPARSTLRLLPTMLAGQAVIHLLLIALAGQHHELVTVRMLLMHLAGTALALLAVTVGELLLGIGAALGRRVVAFVAALPLPAWPAALRVYDPLPRPSTLLALGTVGTRGPPLHG